MTIRAAMLAVVLARAASAGKSFEVADVRIAKSGTPSFEMLPGGKLTVHYITMRELIAAAWNVREDYVTAGPSWLGTEHYDIVAKAAGPASERDLTEMLRTLLEERFKLAVHTEKKVMPLYLLTVGKGGRLKPAADGAAPPSCRLTTPQQRKDGQILRTLACVNTSIAEFAGKLPEVAAAYFDAPVVDASELTGRFDFTLEWSPRRAGRGAAARGEKVEVSEPDLPVFSAVQSQLGLKLESRKLPVDVVVIDRVERVPADN